MTGSGHARFVLPVPAGSYAITAKLSAFTNPGAFDDLVECELTAGNNFDRTRVLIDTPSDAESMALSVIHVFAASGSISTRWPGLASSTTAPAPCIECANDIRFQPMIIIVNHIEGNLS